MNTEPTKGTCPVCGANARLKTKSNMEKAANDQANQYYYREVANAEFPDRPNPNVQLFAELILKQITYHDSRAHHWNKTPDDPIRVPTIMDIVHSEISHGLRDIYMEVLKPLQLAHQARIDAPKEKLTPKALGGNGIQGPKQLRIPSTLKDAAKEEKG